MKKVVLVICAVLAVTTLSAQSFTVYFTKDITPESLVKIYEALGVTPKEGQRVAVKISTGESSQSNHLRPEFIKNLVRKGMATSWSATQPTVATAQRRPITKKLSNSVDSERSLP